MEISRSTLGLAAGIAGTLFLGYCVYFDQQRRKDPLFKKKLRDRKFNKSDYSLQLISSNYVSKYIKNLIPNSANTSFVS